MIAYHRRTARICRARWRERSLRAGQPLSAPHTAGPSAGVVCPVSGESALSEAKTINHNPEYQPESNPGSATSVNTQNSNLLRDFLGHLLATRRHRKPMSSTRSRCSNYYPARSISKRRKLWIIASHQLLREPILCSPKSKNASCMECPAVC